MPVKKKVRKKRATPRRVRKPSKKTKKTKNVPVKVVEGEPVQEPSIDPPIAAAMMRVHKGNYATIDKLLPGDVYSGIRANLKTSGIARLGTGIVLAADFSPDGKVMAMAAAVSRTPTKSEDYLRDNVPDLSVVPTVAGELMSQGYRREQIYLYRTIAKKDGTMNNAIKKKSALVSQEGTFRLRSDLKPGKGRTKEQAKEELLRVLRFWSENLNGSDDNSVITGSRGLRQLIRRGTRQAIIEGDLFLRMNWSKVKIPTLGKKYSLPTVMQAMSAGDVQIERDLIGLGAERYYWWPDSKVVQDLLYPLDDTTKDIIKKSVSPAILEQLRKDGRALLDSSLIVHIKHAGTDIEPYGQSDIEAAATDIAYSRALKSLDFVTIDSLINRALVVKIGDPNPDSAYHALPTAQNRVNVFNKLMSSVGPNMLVVWAGHDIDKLDIGAHNQILNTDSRHSMALDGIKMATGVSDPLLTGTSEGGNAVAWAGFVSLAAVVSELQDEWAQNLTQIGLRIARENGFEDADLVWEFSKTLLADKEVNAKIAAQAFDRGSISIHTYLSEIGRDYEIERLLKEEEEVDETLFAPRPLPIAGGLTDSAPSTTGTPRGRQPNSETTKIGGDRPKETKTTNTHGRGGSK